jgi:hypothetical protein
VGTVTVETISSDQAWKVFDRARRRVLGMLGADFAERWDAGEFAGATTPEMMEVLVLRPHGR